MTKSGNAKKGTLILVNETNIQRHFCYQKEYWLLGEYEYVKNGVFFTEEADVELFSSIKDIQKTVGGRLFLRRLDIIFEKLEEAIKD